MNPPNCMRVFRWGDTKPSGWAIDLANAKQMLRDTGIEGEVRDENDRVVFVYTPKKPLPDRIEDAKHRLDKAEHALRRAEANVRAERAGLERLLKLQKSREEAGPRASETLPLFGRKDGA